jgi:hypothetical protein
MVVDVTTLRSAIASKSFADQEQHLLLLIQQAEALQVMQDEMLKNAKEFAHVFVVQIGNDFSVEACAFDTVANLIEKTGLPPSHVCLIQQGNVLLPHQTLDSVGITQDAQLQYTYDGPTLLVRDLCGWKVTVAFTGSNTTTDIKQHIQRLKNIPLEQQRLIFDGKQLEDDRRLSEYNVPEGATLHLVLRLRGGMYEAISGRHGFHVLGDEVHFENDHIIEIEGQDESKVSLKDNSGMKPYFESKGEDHCFKSKEELIKQLEQTRLAFLFQRLSDVQDKNTAISSAIHDLLAKVGLSGSVQKSDA